MKAFYTTPESEIRTLTQLAVLCASAGASLEPIGEITDVTTWDEGL